MPKLSQALTQKTLLNKNYISCFLFKKKKNPHPRVFIVMFIFTTLKNQSFEK